MKVTTKTELKWLRNSFLITLLLLPLLISGCKNEVIGPQEICGTGMSTFTNMKCQVVNSSTGVILIPDQKSIGNTDSCTVILKQADGIKYYKDLTTYVGSTVYISGYGFTDPGEKIEIKIDDNIEKVELRYVQYIEVSTSPITRSEAEKLICGTIASESHYQDMMRIIKSRTSSSSIISSPNLYIYVHVLRRTNGSGYNKELVSSTILSNLNKYYNPGGISFTTLGSEYLDIIDNDLYQNATDSTYLRKVCNINNHTEAIDIYVFSESNNKVYIAPMDYSTIMGNSMDIISSVCVLYNEFYDHTTTSHEMGHCLGLFHTHHGTRNEGGFYTEPELVDGSNSAYAGDLITDTPADPCSWDNGKYFDSGLRDAKGQKYNPDPKNLMCYSQASEYFTNEQFKRIKETIAGTDFLLSTLQRTLDDNRHYKVNDVISVNNLAPTDGITWTVKHKSSRYSTPTTETFTGREYKIASAKSEILDVTAKLTFSRGITLTLNTQASIGAPSPNIGTLAWNVAGNSQSGGTNSESYGSALSVSGDFTLNLEYLDPVNAALSGISYTCVTAANRALRGSSMRFTKADCADGFLKIRVSDNCGSSDDYFTIMVDLYGSYYSLRIADGTATISSHPGLSNSKAISSDTAPFISHVEIYDSSGKLVYSKDASDTKELSLPLGFLTHGDYKAVVTDGNYTQTIPFTL